MASLRGTQLSAERRRFCGVAKGQAGVFNFTRDICGEARLIERAFGLGACALAGVVQLIGKQLEPEVA